MGRGLISNVRASWVANKLGLNLVGDDSLIYRVDSASDASSNSLCFAKSEQWVSRAHELAIVICSPEHYSPRLRSAILTESPRLDFARVLTLLDSEIGFGWSSVDPVIHPTARIGQYCVIGKGVRIGAHTVIANHVVIGAEVQIGERCNIKSGAIIGEEGFGFERDATGAAVRLPHIGTVQIFNDVEVGSLTTVCRGTLGDTVLASGVKVDDHVHIAHNVYVGEHSFVIACAEVSGGVQIGRRAWIAPGVSIKNQLKIGDDALIGLGAVVLRDVLPEHTVVGNPGKSISQNKP